MNVSKLSFQRIDAHRPRRWLSVTGEHLLQLLELEVLMPTSDQPLRMCELQRQVVDWLRALVRLGEIFSTSGNLPEYAVNKRYSRGLPAQAHILGAFVHRSAIRNSVHVKDLVGAA